MRTMTLYLDTSVISYLYELDSPDKMDDTLALWEQIKAGEYRAVLSAVTLRELSNCAEPKRSIMANYLNEIEFDIVRETQEINELAQEIINRGILTPKSFDDCTHIASAIISNCDMIISWNFKHLVNVRTIHGVRAITVSNHYKSVDIYSPSVFLKGEEK